MPRPSRRTDGPWILGIGASHHNGSVCLLRGDEPAVSIQDERLSGVKRSSVAAAEPSPAIAYCLNAAGITASDLDCVAYSTAGTPASYPSNDVALNPLLRTCHNHISCVFVPHHLAHAASVYGISGLDDACILVVDGLGSPFSDLGAEEAAAISAPHPEGWEHASLYDAAGSEIRCVGKHVTAGRDWVTFRDAGMPLFHSFGGMYSAVSYQIFGDLLDAGKVMGLAPYGSARFPAEDFFRREGDNFVFLDQIPKRFSSAERYPQCSELYSDLAAAVQAALEQAILDLCRDLRRLSRSRNLCYCGGVALNCTTNELIQRSGLFDRVFIAPASDDSGVAMGAAFYALWKMRGRSAPYTCKHDSYGVAYSRDAVENSIAHFPLPLQVTKLEAQDAWTELARKIEAGSVIGWSRGRSELGPRALGQRSIIADPRYASTRDRINAEIKGRELFRPLAPAILAEKASEWFDIDPNDCSPFMLRTFSARPDKADRIPAVVHVDGTSRAQTVTAASNPQFYRLISAFDAITGIPILLNTSFNGPSEPIVETPEDALWSYVELGLDYVVIENLLVTMERRTALLDLAPRVNASRCMKVIDVKNGGLDADSATAVYVCQLSTAWGHRTARISGLDASVLSLVDGRITGRELANRLETDEKTMRRRLAKLRRMGILDFRSLS